MILIYRTELQMPLLFTIVNLPYQLFHDLYGLAVANRLTAAEANTRNPFAEYGFDKSIMVRSAPETVFEEFFDLEDTVELGGVYFNIRTHKIVGFIPDEKLKNEIDVDLIALSVDPKADKYWWMPTQKIRLRNMVCMKTRPSPYKYDEFITRYTKANTYSYQNYRTVISFQ